MRFQPEPEPIYTVRREDAVHHWQCQTFEIAMRLSEWIERETGCRCVARAGLRGGEEHER